MNWKPELDDSIDDLIRVTQGDKVMFTQREAREAIHTFISTEIIEKLIADVESWHISKGGYTSMAHQLRGKWLVCIVCGETGHKACDNYPI